MHCHNLEAAKPAKSKYKITITGVNKTIESNIIHRLEQSHHLDDSELYVENQRLLLKKVNNQIHEAIRPYGYFHARLKTTVTLLNKQWVVNSHIRLGPITYITSLKVSVEGRGKDDESLKELIKNLPLKVGQAFNANAYDDAKDEFSGWAQQHGYIRGRFDKKEVHINRKTRTCRIELIYNTGDPYTFGDIQIKQNELHPSLIKIMSYD